jgi:hypothetical protein
MGAAYIGKEKDSTLSPLSYERLEVLGDFQDTAWFGLFSLV